MPLELPTSDSLPVAAQHSMVSAKPSTSTVNTIVLSKEQVLTSVCDTLLSNSSSYQCDHPKSIDLVVVSSPARTTQAGYFTTTTTTTPSCQYRLSEIVSRQKDLLFHKEESSEVELEPARQSVYSVRRRSRQFFTVAEEEENESDNDNHTASANKKTNEINPVFNLGESLKKLYFPEQHKKRTKRERKVKTFRKHHRKGDLHGYESDPEGKIGLTEIVQNDPELKTYKSHPELTWTENAEVDETVGVLNKSQSLPNTPRVSPKLIRRNSSSNLNTNEVQKTSPGFSFLASVAGELNLKRKRHEKGIMKVSEGSGQVAATKKASEPPHIVQPQTVTSVVHTERSSNIHAQHFHDFADSSGVDEESHGPLSISSIMKWGTTKKINMSNKESNMFSPTSF